MTGIIDFIYSFIYHPNIYYIISIFFVFWVLKSQLKRGHKHGLSIIIPCVETFSITVSTQYGLIFAFTGSFPESLNFLDDIIFVYGIISGFLAIFVHESKGTRIGDYANNILDKYFSNIQNIEPIPTFEEYLEQIKLARDCILNGDKNQIIKSRNMFVENGRTILVLLSNNENLTQIENVYNHCKNDFEDILNTDNIDDKAVIKISGSISDFIGYLNGILKK